MAITLEQSPTATVPQAAYAPIVYMVSSSIAASANKFRFVCDITIDGSRRARLKVLPNSNNIGVFRVDGVVRQYLEITKEDGNNAGESIWTLGTNNVAQIMGKSNGLNYQTVKIEFGEESATSGSADPTVTMDSTDYFLRVLPAARGYIGLQTRQWDQGGSYNAITGDKDFLDVYLPTDAGSRFLTTLPYNNESSFISGVVAIGQDVTYADYRSYGIILDADTAISSSDLYLVVKVQDTDGTTDSTSYLLNLIGGTQPSGATSDDKHLQYIGLGPANLLGSGISFGTSLANKTVDYYEVFLSTVANPTNGGQLKTTAMRFNIVDADCMYGIPGNTTMMHNARANKITLAWQNTAGGYDYFSFNKRHDRTTKVTDRKTFTMLAGNYDSASGSVDFKQLPWEGGKTTTKIGARREIRANTDIFDEQLVDYLEGLILSPRVYLLTYDKINGGVPVVITDSSFLHKTNVNERGCYTVSVTFEFAREIETTA